MQYFASRVVYWLYVVHSHNIYMHSGQMGSAIQWVHCIQKCYKSEQCLVMMFLLDRHTGKKLEAPGVWCIRRTEERKRWGEMSPVHSYMQSYEGMVKNPKVTSVSEFNSRMCWAIYTPSNFRNAALFNINTHLRGTLVVYNHFSHQLTV